MSHCADTVTIMEKLLTLTELADLAHQVVEKAGLSPKNNQAKARPAPRMLRYYQQQGLLSEPRRSGRTHLFGRRHLLEVLAVKRLQSEGRSLEEIRSSVRGLSLGELEVLAAPPAKSVPVDLADGEPETTEQVAAPTPRRSRAFWAGAPAAPAAEAAAAPAPLRAALPAVPLISGVQLSPGVELLLRTAAPLDASQAAALRAAAAPLLAELAALGVSPAIVHAPDLSEETR